MTFFRASGIRPSDFPNASMLRQEREGDGGEVVSAECFAEIIHGEHGEDRQGDDLLDDLELRGRVDVVSPAIGPGP